MLSSDFKFWVKLFSLYKTWSNDLGRVFFERYRKIKMIAGKIIPQTVRVVDDELQSASLLNTYPSKHWKDNASFKIKSVPLLPPPVSPYLRAKYPLL